MRDVSTDPNPGHHIIQILPRIYDAICMRRCRVICMISAACRNYLVHGPRDRSSHRPRCRLSHICRRRRHARRLLPHFPHHLPREVAVTPILIVMECESLRCPNPQSPYGRSFERLAARAKIRAYTQMLRTEESGKREQTLRPRYHFVARTQQLVLGMTLQRNLSLQRNRNRRLRVNSTILCWGYIVSSWGLSSASNLNQWAAKSKRPASSGASVKRPSTSAGRPAAPSIPAVDARAWEDKLARIEKTSKRVSIDMRTTVSSSSNTLNRNSSITSPSMSPKRASSASAYSGKAPSTKTTTSLSRKISSGVSIGAIGGGSSGISLRPKSSSGKSKHKDGSGSGTSHYGTSASASASESS